MRYCNYCGVRLDFAAGDSSRIPPPEAFPLRGPGAKPASQIPPGAYGYAYPPAPPRSSRVGMRTGITAGVAVLGCVGLLVVLMALPMQSYNQVREKAKQAECKANLHSIQLAVERFGVDHRAVYPPYLIGGEARYTDSQFPQDSDVVQTCTGKAQLCDPLLREGYLEAYPGNPFVKQWKPNMYSIQGAQQVPLTMPENMGPQDMLSNGTQECQAGGTRFGAKYDVMGQVLADPRYPQWDQGDKSGAPQPSYADAGYTMWDLAEQPEYSWSMPGEFFYKSSGTITIQNAMAHGYGAHAPLAPEQVTAYMLGVYGEAKAKGQDVIGPEQALTGFSLPSGKPAPQAWPWTRSIDEAGLDGSPYSAAPGAPELQYRNPNGIRDGVALVLTDAK
jgi:hypothetical protein